MSFQNQKQKWSDKKYNNIFAEKTIVSENCEVMNSQMDYYSRIKALCHLRDSNLGDYSIISNSTYVYVCKNVKKYVKLPKIINLVYFPLSTVSIFPKIAKINFTTCYPMLKNTQVLNLNSVSHETF